MLALTGQTHLILKKLADQRSQQAAKRVGQHRPEQLHHRHHLLSERSPQAHLRPFGPGWQGRGESAFGGVSGREAPGVLAGAVRPAGGWERDPPGGSESRRGLPYQGRVWSKEEAARAGGVGAPRLSECLPQVNLACLKLSLPDRGRRVRYGKLRFPSCTPFHPPGAPLPLGGRREPCFRLLPAFGKSREDRFLPASPSRASHGPCALARRAGSCLRALTPRAFAVSRDSGGRASGNNQRKRRLPARGLGGKQA